MARREALPVAEISREVCSRMSEWDLFRRAEQVLFYFPFRHEIDLRALFYEFPEKAWFLPAVLPSHAMAFRRVGPDFKMDNGRYGIPEPPEHATAWVNRGESALLLAPGLMFDVEGYRLGYGKGYYDRFLNQPPVQQAAMTLAGIVPEALLCPSLPHDGWDIPMAFLATETGIRKAVQPLDHRVL